MVRKIPPRYGKKEGGTSGGQRKDRKPTSHNTKRQDTKKGRGIRQAPPRRDRSKKTVRHQELSLTRTSPSLGWCTPSTVR